MTSFTLPSPDLKMKQAMSERPSESVRLDRFYGGAVCQLVDGVFSDTHPSPKALLPGSFRPLHDGHRQLAHTAARRLGCEVHFELSFTNVDKPDLTEDELTRRLGQFVGLAPVWVTRAAAFEKKADLFPGAVFVLGHDTALRLIDPKYYGGETARDAALRKLLDRGCRVLVGGRMDEAGMFRVWDDLRPTFRDLFETIPEADFRADISSTELRKTGGG